MKQKKQAGKKGDINLTMIVGFIIILMSFVIILIVLGKYASDRSYIDKETCHQSVIYRSSAKIGPLEASTSAIPLKCQTEKICFSMSGKDCEEVVSTKNNAVKKIRLSTDKVKAKQEVLDTLAESMKECHWMLGEGQLNFMPKDWLELDNTNYGLICTRFGFDSEAKETLDNIRYGELYSSLEKKKISDGRSYLEYVYHIKNSEEAITLFEYAKAEGKGERAEDFKNIQFVDFAINPRFDGGYVLVASIAPKGTLLPVLAGVGTAVLIPVGAGLIATGIGAPAGIALIGIQAAGVGGLVSGGMILWYNYEDEFSYSPPQPYTFDIRTLKALNIESFEVAP